MWPVDLAQDVCVATIYKILEQATSYKLRPTSYKLQSTHHQPMLQSTIYKIVAKDVRFARRLLAIPRSVYYDIKCQGLASHPLHGH